MYDDNCKNFLLEFSKMKHVFNYQDSMLKVELQMRLWMKETENLRMKLKL